MAKVTGPLHSISATGAFGKNIVFTGSTGGARAIMYKSPKGTGGIAQKALYKSGVATWKALNPATKSAWKATGKTRNITGFNAFISNWLLTPAKPAGIAWDGGAAIWDGGAAVWQ